MQDLPTRRLLSWWKAMSHCYPNLSVVAQSILGHTASSAQIERDFGMAGRLLSGQRSRLDSAFVDVSLYLNANFEQILSRIPELDATWSCQVPKRFTGETSVDDLRKTQNDTEEDSGEESDKDAGLWDRRNGLSVRTRYRSL